ncbi:hypothetical protein GCM10023187_36670 [Nibrella viscosa]|uniref:Phosphatidic acid phosphatase type 2/haloperoxidase domain-containing protein n=1 Tax=Nibrella viscosa TaxID=1084524 RepID=A0ABP8KMV3_9BACT
MNRFRFPARLHRLAARYPRLSRWLLNRFDRSRFTGLPLMLLAGILLFNGYLFSEITENIINAELMVKVDQQVTQWLFQHRSVALSQFLYRLTFAGQNLIVLPLAIGVSGLLLWQRRWFDALLIWIVLAGIGLSIEIGKPVFHRVRPANMGYYTVKTFSFPSGHSATALGFYGLLLYLWLHEKIRPLWRWTGLLACLGLIGLIGFSRLYLGVHFLSDVAGGYLLGLSWLTVGAGLRVWRTFQSRIYSRNIKST